MSDLLFAFTEWLRNTPLVELSLWISNTWLCMVIVTNFWAIPAIQTVHILSIAALFGSAVMLNLRVLGLLWGHLAIGQVAQRFVPWMRWAIVMLVVSGMLLIVGEPVRELINPIFWIKMLLVALAIVLSVFFNRRVSVIPAGGAASLQMRLGAVLLIILWCAVMAGGRWIAYAPV
ncbi:MAG TPA: DUF6644 family protein [Sphingomonadaceae bacterium]|nr:DUF6644 family protein [Sphingomonadaceae bacterium]